MARANEKAIPDRSFQLKFFRQSKQIAASLLSALSSKKYTQWLEKLLFETTKNRGDYWFTQDKLFSEHRTQINMGTIKQQSLLIQNCEVK